MNSGTEILLVIACAVVLVAAAFVIGDHVTCFNFLGLTKGCVTH